VRRADGPNWCYPLPSDTQHGRVCGCPRNGVEVRKRPAARRGKEGDHAGAERAEPDGCDQRPGHELDHEGAGARREVDEAGDEQHAQRERLQSAPIAQASAWCTRATARENLPERARPRCSAGRGCARTPGVETADTDPPGIVRVRADNPSPLTLDGTNSYVVGGYVVDPGSSHREHLEALRAAAPDGIEGVVLTHSHVDHSDGADELGAPVTIPAEGERVGPFLALATPGHSADSVCLLAGRACLTGDTVLGAGSVFIAPGDGSLSAYLSSLRRLRELDLDVICPGHGPYVTDPAAKLDEYIAHRLDRERRLLEALDSGLRTRAELLDAVWSDAPAALRPAAALTLAAHLEKLVEEGRVPADV
jgi:glyoxylase-like metal-dependent hydrolase (beta-lactamase superfamily II)